MPTQAWVTTEKVQLIHEQVTPQQVTVGGSIADQQKKCSHQKILSQHTITTVDQRDQISNLKDPSPKIIT